MNTNIQNGTAFGVLDLSNENTPFTTQIGTNYIELTFKYGLEFYHTRFVLSLTSVQEGTVSINRFVELEETDYPTDVIFSAGVLNKVLYLCCEGAEISICDVQFYGSMHYLRCRKPENLNTLNLERVIKPSRTPKQLSTGETLQFSVTKGSKAFVMLYIGGSGTSGTCLIPFVNTFIGHTSITGNITEPTCSYSDDVVTVTIQEDNRLVVADCFNCKQLK